MKKTQSMCRNCNVNRATHDGWCEVCHARRTNKHTPGEWKAGKQRISPCNGVPIYAQRNGQQRVLVAEASDMNSYDLDAEVEANACLIAAGPELLEVCEWLSAYMHALDKAAIGCTLPQGSIAIDIMDVDAAITKAKGE